MQQAKVIPDNDLFHSQVIDLLTLDTAAWCAEPHDNTAYRLMSRLLIVQGLSIDSWDEELQQQLYRQLTNILHARGQQANQLWQYERQTRLSQQVLQLLTNNNGWARLAHNQDQQHLLVWLLLTQARETISTESGRAARDIVMSWLSQGTAAHEVRTQYAVACKLLGPAWPAVYDNILADDAQLYTHLIDDKPPLFDKPAHSEAPPSLPVLDLGF